jgi:hypothetical protein
MDGLITQLAAKAGLHGYVSTRNVDIGDLQTLASNPDTIRQGNSAANQSAAGTQLLFLFA